MGQIAIPSSGGSGTVNITTNGSHDVKKYATANVNVTPTITKKTASGSIFYNGYTSTFSIPSSCKNAIVTLVGLASYNAGGTSAPSCNITTSKGTVTYGIKMSSVHGSSTDYYHSAASCALVTNCSGATITVSIPFIEARMDVQAVCYYF